MISPKATLLLIFALSVILRLLFLLFEQGEVAQESYTIAIKTYEENMYKLRDSRLAYKVLTRLEAVQDPERTPDAKVD
ncbi:MAG: hypothetical protein ACQUHE_14180, partial [Bacteroidia bacterium]